MEILEELKVFELIYY